LLLRARGRKQPERLLGFAVVVALALSFVRPGAAETAAVPPELQASLLSKACSYDRGFRARAGDTARILIVVRSGSARSEALASYMKGVFGNLADFAGLPHEQTVVPYQSAEILANRCRTERIAVVYVSSDLDDDIEAVRSTLTGVDVMTVAATPTYVDAGIVLGFDLISGKPKLLLNYTQARAQHVDFPTNVLLLMKIVSR
jgi:hypothetical protein